MPNDLVIAKLDKARIKSGGLWDGYLDIPNSKRILSKSISSRSGNMKTG